MANSTNSKNAVITALQSAAKGGHITPISSTQLMANLNALTIPQTIGSQVPLLESVMPLVLNLVVDISYSLFSYEKAIVDAINDTVEDFKKLRTKTGQEIYLSIKFFSYLGDPANNLRTIQDFIHIQDYKPLTDADYVPNGDTPLVDAMYDGVTQTMAFGASTFAVGATGVQEITCVITDGMENRSTRLPSACASFLNELNQKPHFVAAMIGLGSFDFTSMGLSMGLLPGNILKVEKTKTGIAKALKLYASSVGSHSQSTQAGKQAPTGKFFT